MPRGVGGADRLVCFGLGSLQGAGAAGDTGRLDQYAAALTMAEVLGARWRAGGGAAAGAWSCRVMAQDPAYTPVDEVSLCVWCLVQCPTQVRGRVCSSPPPCIHVLTRGVPEPGRPQALRH